MSKIGPILAGTLIAAAGFVGANGVALAATGNSLILGHTNTAGATTTVHRSTHGPVLRLQSQTGSAPLAVNSPTKVKHLNADLVDGKNASALQTRAIRYVMPTLPADTSRVLVNLPNLPHGIYMTSYSILTTVDTSGNAVGCAFTNDGGITNAQILSYGAQSMFGSYVSTSSSGTLDLRSGTIQLECFSQGAGNFNFYQDPGNSNESTVTLVKIDGLSVRTNATPAAVTHAHLAHGPAR